MNRQAQAGPLKRPGSWLFSLLPYVGQQSAYQNRHWSTPVAVYVLSGVIAGSPSEALGELAHQFEHSFRGSAPIPPPLTGFGPEADKVLKPTPQGLRIDLPAGRANKGPSASPRGFDCPATSR